MSTSECNDGASPPASALRDAEHNLHVGLTHSPLELSVVIDLVRSPSAGALVSFTGTTRDTFKGNRVLHLDYESYEPLALKSMLETCKASREKFDILGAACFHRLGRVHIGEESIVIAVASAHRKEAWLAGEWILEEVKRKTEVWKKETFVDAQKGTEDTITETWKANEEFARKRVH